MSPHTLNSNDIYCDNGEITYYFGGYVNISIPDSIIIDGIKQPITKIGSEAFAYNSLQSVQLSNKLTVVGFESFYYNGIKSIVIPNSVTTLKAEAFGINELTNIQFESNSNIRLIGDGAFGSNDEQTFTLPSNINNGFTTYSDNLGNTYNVNDLASSDWGLAIHADLKQHTLEITDVKFEDGQILDYYAGYNSIIIPDKFVVDGKEVLIENLGTYSFMFSALSNIELSANTQAIGPYSFYENQLTNIDLPNKLYTIGKNAFTNNNLTSILLPNPVIKEDDTFSSWNNSMGDIVTEITVFYLSYQAQFKSDCIHTTSSILEKSCDSYTSPSGKVWTTSDIYTDTITNSVGCDSIITIDLTIGNTSTSSISETACDSYTSPSGKVWSSSGTFVDTIPNTAGCDSIITIDLVFDCANSILGYEILPISIYPNPANNFISIGLEQIYDDITLEITNLTGQIISRKNYKNTDHLVCNLEMGKGLYFIKVIINEDKMAIVKVIKE